MTVKEQISIERLLEWAYRVQQVDRIVASEQRPAATASSAWALRSLEVLGTVVDCANGGYRRPDDRDASEDARTVHDAVLALDTVWIGWSEDGLPHVWDKAGAAAAGFTIEGGGGRWWLYPQRAAIGEPMMPRPLEQVVTSVLVIQYARTGASPPCYEGWTAPRGAPAARDGQDTDRYGRRRQASTDVTAEDVTHARNVYAVWRAALELLAASLAETLDGFIVTGPTVAKTPWALPSRRVIPALVLQNSTPSKPMKRIAKKRA